jgi:competence protein ComEC
MRVVLFFLTTLCAFAQSATFYLVDIGHGNVAFAISPSGETVLLDCGPGRAVNRIYDFTQQNGIKKIDYMVISHFEEDHMGAAAELSKKIPILNWVDHGESATYGKSDEWWKAHRGPWWREGIAKRDDANFDKFKSGRDTGHHIAVKPGDKVPVQGLDVTVVTGGGKELAKPMHGAGQKNPACSQVKDIHEDDAEDGQSVGVVLANGKFRFVYLGDLTWNSSNRLFCPTNKVGTVDVYLVTHHAQSMSNELGEYYHGLSCCSAAEVHGLNPRVGLLSMGKEGHGSGTPDAIKMVLETPGLDLWQTEKITGGGEAGFNTKDDMIANLGARSEKVPYLKVVANPDGSFIVTNSRNNFSKSYPKHK